MKQKQIVANITTQVNDIPPCPSCGKPMELLMSSKEVPYFQCGTCMRQYEKNFFKYPTPATCRKL